jgi:hypothetical protein
MTESETLLMVELIRNRDREIERLELQMHAMRGAIEALADYAIQVREYLKSLSIETPMPPVNRLDQYWGGNN